MKMNEKKKESYAHVPLFRDPIYDGAADPTIIWNEQEKQWWVIYTNRRATAPGIGVSWVHGTSLGIASSSNGVNWKYRGIIEGLEVEQGHNTFWAPEIVFVDGMYHMYVSYIQGIPTDWPGVEREIRHYTSKNLWDWTYQSPLHLSSNFVIDAAVHQHPDGSYRLWYKDEAHDSHTYVAKSDDLYEWEVIGPVITGFPHEGANVFYWKSSYWLIVDSWKGQVVFRSSDCENWEKNSKILDEFGQREDDYDYGRHADVLVHNEEAYIFYFTHPGVHKQTTGDSSESKRSSIQVAKLELKNGIIKCNRDESLMMNLKK